MRYIYKAKKGPQEAIEGKIEAANKDVAISKIVEQGMVPVLVEEESKYLKKESPVSKTQKREPLFQHKVTKNDIYFFTKQLRILLRSHISILNSLYILKTQVFHKEFKKVVSEIIAAVREGGSFSESLEGFPQHFSSLYISLIRAGEVGGKLDYALGQISEYMEKERRLSHIVKSSLAYPAIMIIVGIATIMFLITFVIPKLKVVFEDFVTHLPLITKVLLNISLFFSNYWLLIIIFFIALFIFLFKTKETQAQKKAFYKIKMSLPVVRDIIRNQALARFARGLSVLLGSGISILESVRITTPLIDDEVARAQLKDAYKQIVEGTGLEESLNNNCRFLPDMFIKMIAVGEASGRLSEILSELAESYEEEVQTKTKIVTSLIEPLAILVIGGVIGLMVISILLPIFEMSLFLE